MIYKLALSLRPSVDLTQTGAGRSSHHKSQDEFDGDNESGATQGYSRSDVTEDDVEQHRSIVARDPSSKRIQDMSNAEEAEDAGRKRKKPRM